MLDHREVEAGKVIELEPSRIGQHCPEIGRGIVAPDREADQVLVAPAIADLDHAQPVAPGNEAHGFGIDRNRSVGEDACGQVLFVKMHCHVAFALRLIGD